MSNNQKIQTGINAVSNGWFRAKIDRKTLKELSKSLNVVTPETIIVIALTITKKTTITLPALFLFIC